MSDHYRFQNRESKICLASNGEGSLLWVVDLFCLAFAAGRWPHRLRRWKFRQVRGWPTAGAVGAMCDSSFQEFLVARNGLGKFLRFGSNMFKLKQLSKCVFFNDCLLKLWRRVDG